MEAAAAGLLRVTFADCSSTQEVRIAEDIVAAVVEAAVEVCIDTVEKAVDKTDDSALAWAYTLLSQDRTPCFAVSPPLWIVGSKRWPYGLIHTRALRRKTSFNGVCRPSAVCNEDGCLVLARPERRQSSEQSHSDESFFSGCLDRQPYQHR